MQNPHVLSCLLLGNLSVESWRSNHSRRIMSQKSGCIHNTEIGCNDQCSSPQTICCGVPQGSILGPLFFLLYINDLNNVSTLVELILFADDTNLFMSHKDPVYLAASLNSELNKLSTWFKANKLSLNLRKQTSCYLSLDRKGIIFQCKFA